jgi:hypothetical protein
MLGQCSAGTGEGGVLSEGVIHRSSSCGRLERGVGWVTLRKIAGRGLEEKIHT